MTGEDHGRGVRPATAEDVPGICDLLTLLFIQEREFRPDRDAQARGVQAILADPAVGHILVLGDRGQPFGMVSLLYTVSTALGGKVALLEDMVVLPAHRGAGNGRLLLSSAIAFARRQGCLRITLLTDGDNARAQRLYLRHGFAPSAMLPLRLIL